MTMTTPDITYVLPYYRAPAMLRLHLNTWCAYDRSVTDRMCLIVVDDCSPEPAEPVMRDVMSKNDALPIRLFRIDQDIPWNRNGARNLGSYLASTPWVLHTDIDHLLSPVNAWELTRNDIHTKSWYRFERCRIGAADDTRKKDAISADAEHGKIKPHGDSYLCTKDLYWRTGGYDEDYSGHLGGGTPFLEAMKRIGGPAVQLPVELALYTRNAVSDANVSTLSRDTSHYTKTRAAKKGALGKNPLRFTWGQLI